VADSSRYEVLAGCFLVCRDCGVGKRRHIVAAFSTERFIVEDLNTEVAIHENDAHDPVFDEATADPNAVAAERSAKALSGLADRAERELLENDYYRAYEPAFAYRDGMVNGMGGPTGDMASLLGPVAVRALALALTEIYLMDRNYSELIADHNRKICEDHTCSVFGHLVDVARAVSSQIT
jgi:hypothetical protein